MRHDVEETIWIPLDDGTRLAARIWMPDTDRPVPAVLEYLPYRRRDNTAQRDESTYPDFAAAGIAGVRVDSRGNGDSEGHFDDEYSETELSDACQVIEWIARQDWCSGSVGMMGISWGGFNALQVAALRPPALKAVISIASTADRYNDDIHYKNGCLLGANVSWAGSVFANTSRPPDPDVVGENWRELWLERLNAIQLPLEPWMAHQRRDAYWRHGSIREDWEAIDIPVFIISGFGDGYRNAPATFATNLKAPVKAMVGPWIHKYPHMAWPRPRADFLSMAIAWWCQHLGGESSGVDGWPRYRAWIAEGVRPGGWREREEGRWVGLDTLPSDAVEHRPHTLGADRRIGGTAEGTLTLRSPENCGTACGEFFARSPGADLPGDQRRDDGLSLLWESAALDEPLDLLGRAEVQLPVAIDQPQGNLIARLVDVHPDGTAALIARGALNLCHRHAHDAPEPMVPGRTERVRVVLDECGYRLLPGHRLRLALSTAYWPLILPSPAKVTATIEAGEAATLTLPVLTGGEDATPPLTQEAEPMAEGITLTEGADMREVSEDVETGETRYEIGVDTGLVQHPEHGMVWHETRNETWRIDPHDPAGASGVLVFTTMRQRMDMRAETRAEIRFTCGAAAYEAKVVLTAQDSGTEIFRRSWSLHFPRDHI